MCPKLDVPITLFKYSEMTKTFLLCTMINFRILVFVAKHHTGCTLAKWYVVLGMKLNIICVYASIIHMKCIYMCAHVNLEFSSF